MIWSDGLHSPLFYRGKGGMLRPVPSAGVWPTGEEIRLLGLGSWFLPGFVPFAILWDTAGSSPFSCPLSVPGTGGYTRLVAMSLPFPLRGSNLLGGALCRFASPGRCFCSPQDASSPLWRSRAFSALSSRQPGNEDPLSGCSSCACILPCGCSPGRGGLCLSFGFCFGHSQGHAAGGIPVPLSTGIRSAFRVDFRISHWLGFPFEEAWVPAAFRMTDKEVSLSFQQQHLGRW